MSLRWQRRRWRREISFAGFSDVKAGIVEWPMSVIRISAADKERLIALADKILLAWRGYTDEAAFVFAETDGEAHNTITPIARRRGTDYRASLTLCCAIILQRRSIRSAYITRMQSCIISRRKISD